MTFGRFERLDFGSGVWVLEHRPTADLAIGQTAKKGLEGNTVVVMQAYPHTLGGGQYRSLARKL